MISEEQLQEWQRLANEATKGPWIYVHDDFDETRITTSDREDGGFVHIASVDTDYEGHFGKEQEANLALILAAREAVPALIAEVRRLKRQVEWIASQAPYHESCIYEFQKEKKPNNCDNKCEKCWLKEAQDVQ